MDPIGLAFAGGVLVVILAVREIRRRREAARQGREAARRLRDGAEFMRKAGEGKPPMTPADAEALERWFADNTLPYVALALGNAPPATPRATSFGGQPWLPQGEAWPMSQAGLPMIFLAQLNFADMPKLPDYPDRGLLLIFLAPDDLFGADFGQPDKGDIRLIWIPDPGIAGAPQTRPGPVIDDTPFRDTDVQLRGRGVTFSSGVMPPRVDDWRIEKQWPAWWARGDNDRFHDLLDSDREEWGPTIYIGGHPRFCQSDIREDADPRLAEHDRVLLQVGSCDEIIWGDVGEAAFLIRRTDLLAGAFTDVSFTWDSH